MECHRVSLRGETPWPSDGHGATGPGNSIESELSCRFPGPVTCALEERRCRLFSSSFNSCEGLTSDHNIEGEGRQNDRRSPIACHSAVKIRRHVSDTVTAFWRGRRGGWLGVLGAGGWRGGLAVLVGRAGSVSSVALWLLRFPRYRSNSRAPDSGRQAKIELGKSTRSR
jgi:hypothetical protein